MNLKAAAMKMVDPPPRLRLLLFEKLTLAQAPEYLRSRLQSPVPLMLDAAGRPGELRGQGQQHDDPDSDTRFSRSPVPLLPLPVAPPFELLKHFSSEKASAHDPSSLAHHLKQNIFSVLTDDREVRKINNECGAFVRLACLVPCSLKFWQPWTDKTALEQQYALRLVINCRDFEHDCFCPPFRQSNVYAKLGVLSVC
jgi:hypothetical protein